MSTRSKSTFFACSVVDGVAHIEMNRPDKANAMSPDFWSDLPVVVGEMGKDHEVRAIVLSGRGKHFTGGMDLAAFQGIMDLMQHEPGRGAYSLRELIATLQSSLSALEAVRVPVIAAIHGACLGGGIDLISACDIVLASENASFGIEEIDVGMTADVGTLQRLPKLMPLGIVRELAYTGRRFSAHEAKQWGLVNAVHSDRETVIEAALSMAQTISQKSPLAVAGAKYAITYARDHSVGDGLDQIATWNGGMLRQDDLMKAMQAKVSKQRATFDDLLKEAG